MTCDCCGARYDMNLPKGERCTGECWNVYHWLMCPTGDGEHCAIHCRGMNAGPEVDDWEYDESEDKR